MKKRVLLPVLAVSMLALAVPVLADETEGAPPAFSEEDRPELPPNVKRTDVVAVFAKPQAQPAPETMNGEPAQKAPDKPQEAPDKPLEAPDEPQEAPDQPKMLDTIWIYYADNSFDQYTDVDGRYQLFSRGNYTLDGSFKEGSIVINRTEKMTDAGSGPEAYESSHEYQIGTLGFELLAEKGILAIFGDASHEEFTGADGITRYLDTFWIFFEDGTFRQYVFHDEDVVLFSSGRYEFDDIGDFHMPFDDKEHGTITLNWDESVDPHAKLSQTCDLNSLGMDCLFERYEEEELPAPEQ